MPVLIAAPASELDVVRPLATRLREDGGEVRCYLEEDDHELREIGCKIAAGALDDEMNLEGALTNVHTFIPLFPDPALLLTSVEVASMKATASAMAGAAAGSGVEQTILVLPALSKGSGALAETYQAVERSFQEVCRPLCLLRTGFVWGPERPFAAALRSLRDPAPNKVLANGDLPVPVVQAEDLVALIAAVDDREQAHGEWEFGGNIYLLKNLIGLPALDGQSSETSMEFFEALTTGLTVGQSATDEFGVAPRSL
jgi:hypothetical protein